MTEGGIRLQGPCYVYESAASNCLVLLRKAGSRPIGICVRINSARAHEILSSGLLAVLAGTAATRMHRKENVRYMRSLQLPYSLRLYGKLVIPRLGT